MLTTVWGVVHEGKVELLEPLDLPEGARVLVTLLPDDERQFWLHASRSALDTLWDNVEDDVYAQLREE